MAQGQRVDALTEQLREAVPATGLAPGIVQAAGHGTGQTQPAVDRVEQRNAAIAGDVAAAEIGLDLATFNGLKLQRSMENVLSRRLVS